MSAQLAYPLGFGGILHQLPHTLFQPLQLSVNTHEVPALLQEGLEELMVRVCALDDGRAARKEIFCAS
eukprot:CAMPEP_0206249052 /NCGR_PEP_ID=MMETSP0047_2-20121206/20701_1 /ASSEMBLY_ACC=CAM_ASM_000192 /TAXON_ID=195065 /ORGANISM="Chroomonas mesostigmatica_cf, Strain CCMP1168" /LENGTH=67 /DNA_ID=CAMNT_0053674745 /DNA_START=387 /DNA_END=591 /DNA_ORIENTATION=-